VRILLGSSVRQECRILERFLDSLRDLQRTGTDVDYLFIDDCDDSRASAMLRDFRPLGAGVDIERMTGARLPFVRDRVHHHWNERLTWRVAAAKDRIIRRCLDGKYDHLFLVDSDLVLHPETLARLVETGKDIISELFWTRFRPYASETPQVWLSDHYTLFRLERGEKVSDEERDRRIREFASILRRPGVYRVGGLGACTLLSRRALRRGVRFAEIYNVSMVGEDRHLCLRAAALGLELFVDTCLPALHLYRESDLDKVPEYLAGFRETSVRAHSLLVMTAIKEGLEQLETMDFRQSAAGGQARSCFTAQGWRTATAMRARGRYRQDRCIQRPEVADITLSSLDPTDGTCEASVRLNLRGSRAGHPFRMRRTAVVRAVKRQGAWLIDDCRTTEEEEGRCAQGPVSTLVSSSFARLVRPRPQRITLAMLVRNEADRYLRDALAHAARYVDDAVILDDASDDATVEVCRETLRDLPVIIQSNRAHGFSNESNLRRQLWNLVVQGEPDWILCLDADEILEDRAFRELRRLTGRPDVDAYTFRLYDFWDTERYREDRLWRAHLTFRPFMVRYQPRFPYEWHASPLHCGRFPRNVLVLPSAMTDLRVKHFGWATLEDRRRKYDRYMAADPDGAYGNLEQYLSILDPNPTLRRWSEEIDEPGPG
jgi:hypothetical protein